MATIYKRGNLYAYSIELYRDTKGKRVKTTKSGFRTKREAQEAVKKAELEIAAGTFVQGSIPFHEFANKWLDEHSQFIKESTADRYRIKVRQISEYFAGKKLDQISRFDIQQYINKLAQERSLANVSEFKVTLKQIFDTACKYDVLSKNPCTYIKIPPCKVKPRQRTYMEKETLIKFLETAKLFYDDKTHAIFFTLAYTGMRVSELSALQWTDINFDDKTISIDKSLYQTTGRSYTITTPKTQQSIRKIVISDELVNELKMQKSRQNKYRILHGTEYDNQGFVFADEKGRPIFQYDIYNKSKTISKKINFHVHPHLFRHTHTSLLAEAGVSLEVIQERLGHANDATTKEIYLHVTKSLKNEAAEKFSKLLMDYKGTTK